jgi:hypothetical protein
VSNHFFRTLNRFDLCSPLSCCLESFLLVHLETCQSAMQLLGSFWTDVLWLAFITLLLLQWETASREGLIVWAFLIYLWKIFNQADIRLSYFFSWWLFHKNSIFLTNLTLFFQIIIGNKQTCCCWIWHIKAWACSTGETTSLILTILVLVLNQDS